MVNKENSAVVWSVNPTSDQLIIRKCPKCSKKHEYVSSGRFRVNAQRKTLDVWHIYKGVPCDNTWNIEVLARKASKSIPRDLLDQFHANDAETALAYSYDYSLLARNRVELAAPPEFVVSGPSIEDMSSFKKAAVKVCLQSPYSLPIRLDKVLSEKLAMSRKQLEECVTKGDIFGFDKGSLSKQLPKEFVFSIRPGSVAETLKLSSQPK